MTTKTTMQVQKMIDKGFINLFDDNDPIEVGTGIQDMPIGPFIKALDIQIGDDNVTLTAKSSIEAALFNKKENILILIGVKCDLSCNEDSYAITADTVLAEPASKDNFLVDIVNLGGGNLDKNIDLSVSAKMISGTDYPVFAEAKTDEDVDNMEQNISLIIMSLIKNGMPMFSVIHTADAMIFG